MAIINGFRGLAEQRIRKIEDLPDRSKDHFYRERWLGIQERLRKEENVRVDLPWFVLYKHHIEEMSLRNIAENLTDCTYESLRGLSNKLGLPMRSKKESVQFARFDKVKHIDNEQLTYEYKALKMNMAMLARSYGVVPSTIRDRLNKMGVKRRYARGILKGEIIVKRREDG